ncbi:MAG: hypothetical protein U0531_09480 [Dehalococcoidia bacterium]
MAIGAAPAALALVATGFAGMMLLLVRVPPPARIPRRGGEAGAGSTASLREVFGYIRSQPLVRGMVLITTIPGLLALPYTLLPIFAEGVRAWRRRPRPDAVRHQGRRPGPARSP